MKATWAIVALLLITPLATGQLLGSLMETPDRDPGPSPDQASAQAPGSAPRESPAEALLKPAEAEVALPAGLQDPTWNFASTPRTIYQGPGETSDFQWRCPEPANGIPVNPGGGPTGQDPVVYGCPLRIYDTTYALGAPALAVQHDNHNNVAFAGFHGTTTSANAPHDYSRASSGGYHGFTLFPSEDQGLTWRDEPPSTATMPSNALGADASVVMDSAGNLYVAYLYDIPTGSDRWDAAIQLTKGGPTSQFAQPSAYMDSRSIYGADENNRIERVHLTHKPHYVPLKEIEAAEFNESAPPTNETQDGEVAYQPDYENATEERVVLTWHESAFDWRNSSTGLSGWIGAAWTHVGQENDWEMMPRENLIGPCKGASNAVYWDGDMYIACVVEAGYSDRRTARVGDIDIWKFNPVTGNASLVDFTGLNGGQPLLAVNEDGYFSLLSYKKLYTTEGEFRRLTTSSGESWYGEGWQRTNAGDLGPELRRWGGGDNVPALDADITAFVSITDEPTMYVMYKEFHDDPQDLSDEDPPEPDDPFRTIDQRLTDYHKYFFSFNSCDGPIAAAEMELGEAVDAYNAQNYQTNPRTFNEVRDSLFVTRDANGDEVIYFAAGDYGAIQYGAVVGGQSSSFCNFPPLPLVPPPPAVVPAALGLSTGLGATFGAALGVPAVAMVGYLLTAKRRSPSYVTAEDE